MIFGILTVCESLFGFIINFIPGYLYLKMAALYILIRNDFVMTNHAFKLLQKYYKDSDLRNRTSYWVDFMVQNIAPKNSKRNLRKRSSH
ncbi:MAG: hypothetical protein ACK42G_06905, partial [Candidatus Kapaibacteriota bacterium]